MDSLLAVKGPEPEFTLCYAESQPIDLYNHRAAQEHLVIIIHGGFWRVRYDRCHLRPLAAWWAGQGLGVALPEFRRVGQNGGGWPGTAQDIERGIAYLRETLQPSRATLVGHSSGGHLAILAACNGSKVDHTISLAGVLDLGEAQRTALSCGAVDEFLQSAPLEVADPLTLGSPKCRVTLFHGACDDEVPANHSIRYANQYPDIELQLLAGVGHYAFLDPAHHASNAVLQSMQLQNT